MSDDNFLPDEKAAAASRDRVVLPKEEKARLTGDEPRRERTGDEPRSRERNAARPAAGSNPLGFAQASAPLTPSGAERAKQGR